MNRNEFGHNECFTQTVLFRCNHRVLSLWVQLKYAYIKNYTYIHACMHAYIRTYVRTSVLVSKVDAYLHVYSKCLAAFRYLLYSLRVTFYNRNNAWTLEIQDLTFLIMGA